MVDYKFEKVPCLVSVIIPTYKRPGMLGRAIDSVLNQKYSEVEIIVVDDNTDGDDFRLETIKFMERYVKNPKVTYLRHTINQNGSAARNTGIVNARGEYIAFLDDDDFFLSNRIVDAVNYLKTASEEYGGVCVNYIKRYKNKVYKVGQNIGSFSSCYELLSGKVDYAAGSTFLIRRDALDKVGLFDISYRRHQDWEFLIRFFRFYKMQVLPSIDVVICADSIRNMPNTISFLEIKKRILTQFENDINDLGSNQKREIHQAQWKEILCCFLKERKYRCSYAFAISDVSFSYWTFSDYLNLVRSFIIGIFPSIMKFIYFLYNLKYRKITIDLF